MNVFEEILLLPGAAPILADKLSGRIVGRVADGFDTDPALGDMMNLFRAIENKWPSQTYSLRDMYDRLLKNAGQDTEDTQEAVDGLSEAQRAVWESESSRIQSKVQKFKESLPKIVDLYAAAEPNTESWEDLTPINQWSLLNALERGLYDRLQRYREWAASDEERGQSESNAITLRDDADDAVQPLYDLITGFLADPVIAQALEQDATNGIRVPVRRVA
jgi:hypothetical protein